MGLFSNVVNVLTSVASYAVEKVSDGFSYAKQKAAEACEWIADKGDQFIDDVKAVYQKVKPYLQKAPKWFNSIALMVPFPWLNVGLIATGKIIEQLLALENSPILQKFEQAIRKTIKFAQYIKERYLTPEEVVEANENREILSKVEENYAKNLSSEEIHLIQLNEILNTYGILKYKLREVLEVGVTDFQHYLRLRATQKLLDISEKTILTAENINDITKEDIYLIKTAETLLVSSQLTDENAIKLDQIIYERTGKKLIPFVFEELMAVWVEKQQSLEQEWKNLSQNLSRDRVLKTRLDVAKRTSELTEEEEKIHAEISVRVGAEEIKLNRLDTERRSMKNYVYAAEGFLQILEKTESELEAEGKDYLIDDSQEIAKIIMRVAQSNIPWDSLSEDEKSLITDYANIFEEEGRSRAQAVKEQLEVGVEV